MRLKFFTLSSVNARQHFNDNEAVMGQALVGVHHLAANARTVMPQSRIHDYNEETPSTALLANTARKKSKTV